ncbi:MAG: hypothetical protein HC936_01975 [Leptolyngbyaceae cyanobacterium SU_3_3]|nr:hypothetical protein [Leptolyngbyaceae cyanobacterium SU_3_3]
MKLIQLLPAFTCSVYPKHLSAAEYGNSATLNQFSSTAAIDALQTHGQLEKQLLTPMATDKMLSQASLDR